MYRTIASHFDSKATARHSWVWNTSVKVVTDEEMEQMHEANEKIAEMGLKQMGSPAPKASQKK